MRAPSPIQGNRRKLGERLFVAVCLASIIIPLGMLAVLLGDVVMDGMGRLSWDFIKGVPSYRAKNAGIWPALIGSLYLIGLTILIAVPIGVGAAIYLEEYGRRSRIAGFIEVNIANLAGVPSIIYGLLGLEVFVRLFGLGATIPAGACTLAILVLPVIIMSTREALRTVPDAYREGCYALGATRWQTIRQVVLPSSFGGILTGSILAMARALGEAAPLIVVANAVVFVTFTPDMSSPYTAMPLLIFSWVSNPKAAFLENAAAAIVVLMVMLLLLNSVAIVLRNRFQRRTT